MSRTFVGIIVLLLCSGCISPAMQAGPDIKTLTPEEVAAKTTAKTSEYDANVVVSSDLISCPVETPLTDICVMRFRTSFSKTQPSVKAYQIYVMESYYGREWRFYDSVNLIGGEVRKVTLIDRKVEAGGACCMYTEHLGIPLTEADLNRESLSFRLNAKSGRQEEIVIPGNFLRGYLLGLSRNQ